MTGSVERIPTDPVAALEVKILNEIVMALHPAASRGDVDAIDRMLKTLELKRRYRQDAAQSSEEWRF